MAQADAGEQEYESDPEELKRSLATRRREASDDEEEEDEEVKNQRAEIDSDFGQSADNDENKSDDGEGSYDEEEEGDDDDDDKRSKPAEDDAAGNVDGEEDKEKQSSAVPTGGAFYMHDDRFQELSAGRSRRGRGGRRSWGSGDERKWGHDKFEEMNTTQEKHHDVQLPSMLFKTPRGGFRGRGRGRGQGRGYSRGRSSNASSSNGHQIFVPKATTRVGEARKDEIPLSKGSQVHSSKPLRNSRGSQHWHEKKSHHDSRRSPSAPTQTGNEDSHTKKNVVVSSLSSASPPFYPSVSSSNLVHGIQVGMERLQTNESATPSGKKLRNTKSVYLPVHTAQTFQPTSQVRGAPTTRNVFYPQSHSQGGKFSSPMQLNGDSKGTSKGYIRPSGQDFDQHTAVIRPLSSSTQRTNSSGNRYLPGEIESASDTGASFAKGKGTLQATGSGSLMFSGSQVMGNAESLASSDNSNFPAFLPVMQFGRQHGGVPTFGMAFPGYVQPENGIGNPEMTWMPVLTGPGALGASYSPPYAAVDGSYQAHKPGSSSKENSTNNLHDLEKPMERPELTESGVSKRQNNNSSKQPRRYSEMSFSK
ncbi:protein MLN51 homolog isoform X2 [Brassica rapa]|uniref:protein MLN51 homolog isoform X2 n=1 Tax=Brassica campestris TaxID=3711 RepID=UPI0004F17194|nr:protein MLN51 homolog isoform X2 [Brassica rapa]